jgi:protein-tyrosine phosphatase
MENILKEKKKLYVHCSAGIYRSPQIIALYLILVERYSVETAIEVIKEKHPFAKPNYNIICRAVDEILCRYKGTKKVSS